MDIYLASVLTNMTLIAFLALSAYLVLVGLILQLLQRLWRAFIFFGDYWLVR